MEMEQFSDGELVERFRANDELAAAALYQRYAWRLLVVARMSCGRSFASRFDPEDAVQGAFQELFERLRRPTEEAALTADLWGLLVVLTRSQVRRMVEHHLASKRSVQRTRRTDSVFKTTSAPDPRTSDPHGMIIFREQLDQLPLDDRQVVNLRLQGFEIGEIVERTGRPRRTVERILQHFRDTVADLTERSRV